VSAYPGMIDRTYHENLLTYFQTTIIFLVWGIMAPHSADILAAALTSSHHVDPAQPGFLTVRGLRIF
jgi:hypothetical protein